ncbi:hypothetical protein QBC37DRAFT_379291 [Rhypophila decipiens]|uniref:Uncharacterized protein n=1 Tax=Rhypophila decipiens TaxID=261697 RepID=A0AAN6XWJ7_9PEZI|nr:hypothetical protein QBC37DRAFT_379291 [Rhypophila decipiens]
MEENVVRIARANSDSTEPQEREPDGHRGEGTSQIKEDVNLRAGRTRTQASTGGQKALDIHLLLGLSLFVLVLAAMAGGLEVLKHFSDAQQGLAFVSQDQHFLWKYGPTFVLTIAAACWSRVKYHETQLLPWKLLSRGPETAGNSLLLNHHTPLNIISLVRSARARHFSVSLAIMGDISLRVLIVISTGLFNPELRYFPKDTAVSLLDQFNLTRLTDELSIVDPAISIWAETQKNLQAPSWVTAQGGAVQSFVATEGPAVNITANVSVFEVDQDCHIFSWQPPYGAAGLAKVSDIAPPGDLEILSRLCSASLENSPNHVMSITAFESCPNLTERRDSRGIFVTFFFGFDQAAEISSLLCTQSYHIRTREVTTEWATVSPGNVLSVSNQAFDETPIGLPDINVTKIILGTVGQAFDEENVFGLLDTRWWQLMNYTGRWGTCNRHDDSGFELWTRNTTYLSEILRQTFANVASRIIKVGRVNSSHRPHRATMAFEVMRLMVEERPLRIMEALLALLALITIALMAIQHRFYSKYNSSLISIALTLSHSQSLAELLTARGRHSIKSLKADMQGFLFHLSSDGEILVEKTTSKASLPKSHGNKETNKDDAKTWRRPFSLRLPFVCIIIALSAAIIAALESTYQHSRTYNGIADVSMKGNMNVDWWRYLTTALLVLVGLAYGSISFSLRTIHPYQELRKQRPGNAYAMRLDPFAKCSLFLLPRLVKLGLYPLSAAVLILFLSPLLPVVSSGLFTVQKSIVTRSIQLDVDGWVDLEDRASQPLTKNATSAALIINEAIQYNNLSFPPWTYDEFVFASIDPGQLKNLLPLGSHITAQARLPAIRAQPNCTVLDDGYARPYDTFKQGNFTIRAYPPPGCRPPPLPILSKSSSASSSPSEDASLVLSTNATAPTTNTFLHPLNSSSFGFLAIPQWHVPGRDKATMNPFKEKEEYIPTTPTTICNDGGLQHVFLVYGVGTVAQLDNFTVLHCMPYVEALYVDTNLSIDTTPAEPPYVTVNINDCNPDDGEPSPPREVPGSARPFSSTPYAIEFPPMRDNSQRGQDHIYDDGKIKLQPSSSSHDWFFLALSTAYQGIPESKLAAADNTPLMLERIRHLYAQLAAQYINSEYRSTYHSTSATSTTSKETTAAGGSEGKFVMTPTIQAKTMVSGDLTCRLVQNLESTRILESLLLLLMICGLIILWTSLQKKADVLLPLDPSSVAARMSLLAGSKLVERLKISQDRDGPQEREEVDLWFRDKSFSLRSWDISGSGYDSSCGSRCTVRYGIDIVGTNGANAVLTER